MWRNEKLCTQWKSQIIPVAIGRNTLQQDAWVERGLSVYSAIIVRRGRARGLKLCNYQKKETTQGSSHLHKTAQIFLNFLIQRNKQTQCALKEDSLSGWIIAVCAHHSVMLPAAWERWFDMLYVQHADWVRLHFVQITLFVWGKFLYLFSAQPAMNQVYNNMLLFASSSDPVFCSLKRCPGCPLDLILPQRSPVRNLGPGGEGGSEA